MFYLWSIFLLWQFFVDGAGFCLGLFGSLFSDDVFGCGVLDVEGLGCCKNGDVEFEDHLEQLLPELNNFSLTTSGTN